MSCTLEPAIWSHDTGQQIPCFDRCQLIITWMSNVKEVHGKPRLHVSVNLLFGGLRRRCRRRRCCAYAPMSNAAGHDNHRVVYKSRQPAKFAGFSARFRRLLSLLHESRYVKEMMYIRSHNCLLFTKLQLLKNLKKTLQP